MCKGSPRGGERSHFGRTAGFGDVPSTSGKYVVPPKIGAKQVKCSTDTSKPWNAPPPSASSRFKTWMFVPAVIFVLAWSVRNSVVNTERTMLTNGRIYENWDNGTGFRWGARDIQVLRNVCEGKLRALRLLLSRLCSQFDPRHIFD